MSKYSEQVKADAKAAADYIREHGFWQGSTRKSKDGPCCALGGIWSVCDGIYDRECGVADALKSELGIKDIPAWNDTPGRTKEEVLSVFDKIANS